MAEDENTTLLCKCLQLSEQQDVEVECIWKWPVCCSVVKDGRNFGTKRSGCDASIEQYWVCYTMVWNMDNMEWCLWRKRWSLPNSCVERLNRWCCQISVRCLLPQPVYLNNTNNPMKQAMHRCTQMHLESMGMWPLVISCEAEALLAWTIKPSPQEAQPMATLLLEFSDVCVCSCIWQCSFVVVVVVVVSLLFFPVCYVYYEYLVCLFCLEVPF